MNLANYQSGRLFDRFFADLGRFNENSFRPLRTAETAPRRWSPAVDIQETDEAFILYVDVPGSKPEELDIMVDAGVLTVKGQREIRDDSPDCRYRRTERARGEFVREFSLPDTASTDTIEARVEAGVLTLTIAKVQKAQAKRISVN